MSVSRQVAAELKARSPTRRRVRGTEFRIWCRAHTSLTIKCGDWPWGT